MFTTPIEGMANQVGGGGGNKMLIIIDPRDYYFHLNEILFQRQRF